MRRLFWVSFLLCGFAIAKTPYHIAICGVSRSSEDLELVLELSDSVLIKKCQDKKLDASIRITPKNIEAYGSKSLILSQKRRGSRLSESQAEKFVQALLKRLGEPRPQPIVEDKAVSPVEIPSPDSGEELVERLSEIVPEIAESISNKQWHIESLASVDQWNNQLSTKAYPGVQLGARYRFLEDWELDSRLAFGTSAFQVSDQIAWNQQLFVSLGAGRRFELGHGFSILARTGYLYWGSFSDATEIPKFRRYDIELGAEMIYELKNPDFEIRLLVSGLPINLGIQNRLSARYYFVENWFAALQGNLVSLWAHEPTSTFLSASLGLGVAL